MKSKQLYIFLAVLLAVLVLLAVVAEKVYFSNFEYSFRTRMVNRIIGEKERILDKCLDDMKPVMAMDNHHGSLPEKNIFSVADQNNITILEYLDNKLLFWSDNDFSVPLYMIDSLYSKPIIFMQNGWFLTRTIEEGNEKIVGLMRIHTDYSFQNDIINNGFAKCFHLSENVKLGTSIKDSEYHVYNREGEFLFSLIFPSVKENTLFILIPLCLWAAVLFVVVFLILELAKAFAAKNKKLASAGITLLLFCLIYALVLFTGKPTVFYQTELFSPYRFSLNGIIPSLGHLFLLSLLIAIMGGVCYRNLGLPERSLKSGADNYIFLTGLLIPGALIVSVLHYVFINLVATSNINFEAFKVLNISALSFAGFLSVFFLSLVPLLYLMKVIRSAREFPVSLIIVSLLSSTGVILVIWHHDISSGISLSLFFDLLVLGILLSEKANIGMLNKTVIFSLLFGLYSVYIITVFSERKSTENIKIQAVSLSTENDPEGEQLLLDMWPAISNDHVLRNMMESENFNRDREDWERIRNYLHDTYFNGYWGNYNLNIVLCRWDQPLHIGPGDDIYENCFDFFEKRIKRNGHRLTGTNFYFIDNQGGRSYYLGRILYPLVDNSTHGLFIELYSDVNIFEPGYSALLLDWKFQNYAGLKNYSFAKYINGNIVIRSGDFAYNKNDAEYVENVTDYNVFSSGSYRHVLYKNGNTTVIISRPELTFGDVLISFAYLFAFILLLSNILSLFLSRHPLKSLIVFNFRQKLQISYIGILLFSFILIGIVVASVTISQYKTKHLENIKEKLNSVYLELDNRLASEANLTGDWRNNNFSSVGELLVYLSNIFNTDINLYDLNGFLISTSRPEIFTRNLTSTRMNNLAYINLTYLGKSEYYHKENIGSLEYLSAYVPFFNTEGKVLAYLNLPYFRMQSVLAKEISNMVVAFINFTVLLIVITMTLAVFISGRLTAPLSVLSERLASVGVGRKSEHLSYRGHDEIGDLVQQYNRMVDEIEESAQKLANSEREYAWREMAKQIAHEIKNPLTPMKLNIQQLQKSWNDKVPGFEKKLEKFTKNQIEYIDNLSSIASAFSAFAKMPGTHAVEVNLIEQIKTSLELFKNTANIAFRLKWPHESGVIVFADREQLNGVFSNLIKNSIQSIPPDREGIIKLGLDVFSDRVIVSISDNGSGIPDDLKDKMFTPNFTTKSSGMGLGLSIVKKYIENSGGRIWFESEIGKGTTFFVELPLKYTVEKP
jgi:two-component system nitrogen regulation sensor histidine kinase NtrY